MNLVQRLSAVLTAVMMIAPASAGQEQFFDDLSGNWYGSGTAYVRQLGEVSATCTIIVNGTQTSMVAKGTCGKFVLQKALGFSVKSIGGNKYIGTYTGSKTGPARLEGTLQGDRLTLVIRWGGLVNGDTSATMVLERTGPNSFAQTVVDEVSGKTRNTSRFAFRRQ
jgi:hypothetical protein